MLPEHEEELRKQYYILMCSIENLDSINEIHNNIVTCIWMYTNISYKEKLCKKCDRLSCICN